jgi:hypothetical protein
MHDARFGSPTIASWRPDPPGFTPGRIGQLASTSYTSSGVTTPISVGAYTWAGEYNDQLYFYNSARVLFLWWDPAFTQWKISALLGIPGAGYWNSPTPAVVGTYVPSGTYTGNPIVVVTP